MRPHITFRALAGAVLLIPAMLLAQNTHRPTPSSRKVDQVDDYHGVKVADPYRWLEDDNSEETKAWVEAENKVTSGYLRQIGELPRSEEHTSELQSRGL